MQAGCAAASGASGGSMRTSRLIAPVRSYPTTMPRPFVLGALRLLLLLGPGLCAALRVGVLDRYFPFAYYTEAGRITGG